MNAQISHGLPVFIAFCFILTKQKCANIYKALSINAIFKFEFMRRF